MARATRKAKEVMTRTRSCKNIKKPKTDAKQDCVLISVSTANSRKRKANKERMRQFRAKKAEEKKVEQAKQKKTTKKPSKKK